MSWLRRKRQEVKRAQEPATDPAEARVARERAERSLEEVKRRTPQVDSTVEKSDALRRPDHFAELMDEAFRRRAHG